MKPTFFAILLAPFAFSQRIVPDWRHAVDLRMPRLSSNPTAATFLTIRDGEFVRRIGSTLSLAGRPFRFNGNNTYYLQAEIAYHRNAGLNRTCGSCGRRSCCNSFWNRLPPRMCGC